MDQSESSEDRYEATSEGTPEEVDAAEPARLSFQDRAPVSENGSSGEGRSESPWWLDEPTSEDLEVASASKETDRGDEVEEVPMVDPKEQERSRITPTGLPVRTPGTSFRETDESGSSSAASTSGAIGIRSALNEFTDARTLASQRVAERDEEDDDDSEGRSE